MTDAINAPVRRRRSAEIHTSEVPLAGTPGIDVPVVGKLEPRESESIVAVDKPLVNADLEALKMGEDPLTILISQGSEEFAPWSVPVWVNGKGAEVFLRGQWQELGYLPVGHEVITKRKYVEVLFRSKPISIKTETVENAGENPVNHIRRTTRLSNQFSVIEDKNPMGRAWLQRLMAER